MRTLILILPFLYIAGCTGTDQLARHPLEGQTVTITSSIPEAPFADFSMTIFDKVGKEIPAFQRNQPPPDPTPDLVIQSPHYGKESSPEEKTAAHAIIDSVLADRSMSDQIVAYTEARGAQQLRFIPASEASQADYVLNLEVHDYGIGADSWTTTAFFEISATITLIDQQSGRTIWQEETHDLTTLPKALLQAGMPQEHTETPALLAKKNYVEMADILTGLAVYSADRLTLPLRDAYNQTVQREKAKLVSEAR